MAGQYTNLIETKTMEKITFSDENFFYQDTDNPENDSQHPASLEGVEDLVDKLWDSGSSEQDFENCLKPEHRDKFSEKAYWELLRILAAAMAEDFDDD